MNEKEWTKAGEDVLVNMKSLLGKFPGDTIAEAYINSRKSYYKKVDKLFPVLWKAVFSKRYILPSYRQPDYVKQEACDYLLLDSFFGYLSAEIPIKDHVSAHTMNNFVQSLHYDRPTFYLERELGEPLLRTKLPLDYYAGDINWRWPAFRVYLPTNLLTITRDGLPSSVMFLDICYVPRGIKAEIPKAINDELTKVMGHTKGQIPLLSSEYEGMACTCILDFDSPLSIIAYAASCKLERNAIKDIMKETHTELASPFKTDELDVAFMNKMLALSINILIFLSSVPLEYEQKEVIRKPKMEGKRLITGLYPARFIGQSQ